MYDVFLLSHMTFLMAMSRALRRGLQRQVLIGCEESEDLLVRRLMPFFLLGATRRLRRG